MIIPIFFTAAVCIAGIITWEAWYSVFVLAGIGIHTFCMALPDAQTVRKTLLITCPLVLIYDAFALSIGGMIYESIAMISAVIGIYRMSRASNVKERSDEI